MHYTRKRPYFPHKIPSILKIQQIVCQAFFEARVSISDVGCRILDVKGESGGFQIPRPQSAIRNRGSGMSGGSASLPDEGFAQRKGKCASFVGFAFDPDPPTMLFYNALTDNETQSGAADSPG